MADINTFPIFHADTMLRPLDVVVDLLAAVVVPAGSSAMVVLVAGKGAVTIGSGAVADQGKNTSVERRNG